MQSGHCGIPLSIKGGPGHGRQRRERTNMREREQGGKLIAQAESKE
jgi:hypothetical protein